MTTEHKDLGSFIEFDDAPDRPVLDRSTLEAWATCPAQAEMIERGRVNTYSHLSNVGQAIHDALKQVIDEYVEAQGQMNLQELRDALDNWMSAARPDVQFDAFQASRRMTYQFCKLIASTHVGNILRYDGGSGQRAGQIAHDLAGVRLTCEVDLLVASPSVEVVDLTDYKTGWKFWTESMVRESFQFGFYSYLVLRNYPEIDAVRVKVWNTRVGALTYGVMFKRSDITELEGRIVGAIGAWRDNSGSSRPAVWPAVEKCCICPAAAICPAAGEPISDLVSDPGKFLDITNAISESLKARTKLMSKHVIATGDDIAGSGSLRFGIDKPASSRKPTAKLYKANSQEDQDDAE